MEWHVDGSHGLPQPASSVLPTVCRSAPRLACCQSLHAQLEPSGLRLVPWWEHLPVEACPVERERLVPHIGHGDARALSHQNLGDLLYVFLDARSVLTHARGDANVDGALYPVSTGSAARSTASPSFAGRLSAVETGEASISLEAYGTSNGCKS